MLFLPGHILCSDCLDSIIEKTWSPRQAPACPFCRETFSKDSARKLRIDLKTPRPLLKEIDDDSDSDNLSQPSEAKRLEEKVARAAASKCSFEEVSELHKEIQQWLASQVKRTSPSQVKYSFEFGAFMRVFIVTVFSMHHFNSVQRF